MFYNIDSTRQSCRRVLFKSRDPLTQYSERPKRLFLCERDFGGLKTSFDLFVFFFCKSGLFLNGNFSCTKTRLEILFFWGILYAEKKIYIDGKKLSQNRSCWTTLIGLSNITFHRIEKKQIEKDKFHLSLSFCFSSSTKLWERSLSRFFCLFGLENSNKRDQEICFFGVFRNNWQMALVVIVSILIFFPPLNIAH